MNNILNDEQRGHVQNLLDTMQEQTARLQNLLADGYTPALHDAVKEHATQGYNAAYTPVKSSELLGILNDFKNDLDAARPPFVWKPRHSEADTDAERRLEHAERSSRERAELSVLARAYCEECESRVCSCREREAHNGF